MRLTSGGAVSVASGGGGDIVFSNDFELLGAYSFLNDSSQRSLTFSGDIAGSGENLTLGGTGGSSVTNVVSGSLNLGSGGLRISTGSSWLLNGSNSFTGMIQVGDQGVAGQTSLHITDGAAVNSSEMIRIWGLLGAQQNRLVLSNNVTIDVRVDTRESRLVNHEFPASGHAFSPHVINQSGNNSINGDITISQSGGDGVVLLSEAGQLTLNNLVNQMGSSSRTFGFYGAGDFDVTGTINQENEQGGARILKSGSGTLRLSGVAKDYVGDTRVFGGTLLIDTVVGSASATGNRLSVGTAGSYALGSTATLGGTGTFMSAHPDGVVIGGEMYDRSGNAVASSGALITGGDIGTIGTLTLQSNVSFVGADGALALYHVDMNDVTSDLLMIDGNLDLTSDYSGITFNVDSMTGTGAAFYELINVSGEIFGEFAHVFNFPDGYMLQYGANSIGVAIPEPSTYAAIFGFLALAGCVIRRRFNRRAVS